MALLGQIIRDISALLLLAALAELLLPAGALSRFIRLAIGLMLVAAMINPLLDSISGGLPQPEFDFSSPALASAYIAEGEAISGSLQEASRTEYVSELERQIAALAMMAEGVDQATVMVELDAAGNIETLYLGLVLREGYDLEATEARTQAAVSAFFTAANWQVESRTKQLGGEEIK